MKENKLGTYLSSFSDKDWSSYHKFSKSLYSDKSDYQLVINYIKKNKGRYDPNYMDTEYLRKKIRPASTAQVFANVISGLCKYIEQYLTWAEVENDSMMKDTLLLQALGKRGLTKQFYKQKEKAKKKRDAGPIGLWNNYHDFMGEYLTYYCNMSSVISKSQIVLKQSFEYIEKFKTTISHYLIVEMINRSVVYNENWEAQINENEKLKIQSNTLSKLFEQLILMKVDKDNGSYKLLKNEITNSKLSRDIRYSILIHLLSFITFKRIQGETSYHKDMFELQEYGLKNNILFPSGRIPAPRFINIVHRACGLKEYEWAKQFVTNFSGLVKNETKSSIEILGLAQIESSKENHENVLELLANTKYKIFDQEMRAKWLLLKSTYLLNRNNFVIIEYGINNFKYFIKKNKRNASEITYNSLLNTSNLLLNIAKGKTLEKVKSQITVEKHLFFRYWLIEMVNEKIKK